MGCCVFLLVSYAREYKDVFVLFSVYAWLNLFPIVKNGMNTCLFTRMYLCLWLFLWCSCLYLYLPIPQIDPDSSHPFLKYFPVAGLVSLISGKSRGLCHIQRDLVFNFFHDEYFCYCSSLLASLLVKVKILCFKKRGGGGSGGKLVYNLVAIMLPVWLLETDH